MDRHQQRLWKKMIATIDDYKRQSTGFSRLVGELEGALDAGEFYDKTLVEEWYSHWTDLEALRATRGDAVPYSETIDVVDAMEHFLRGKLSDQSGT
jgi:hypothetical protein